MTRAQMVGNVKGFSLIEVVVTVAVIGIIAAIAVPNMIGWRGERQLQGAARNYAAHVQFARLKSIRETEHVVVLVDDVADNYQIFIDADRNETLDVGEEVLKDENCPVGVSINSVTIPGGLTSLNPRGRSSRTGDVVFQNLAGTIITVSVNILGSVSVTE